MQCSPHDDQSTSNQMLFQLHVIFFGWQNLPSLIGLFFFFGNIYRKTPYFLGKKTRFPVKLFQTRPTHHPNHIQKQGHNLHLNCEHSKPGEPRGTLTGTLVGGKFGDGTANYTGWFIWIPLLGSVIPYNHQATRVLNTAKIHGMLRFNTKRPDNSGIRILP